MPIAGDILFIQKRSVRAGAQTSLARLMRSRCLAAFQPAALLGSAGWLSSDLGASALPVVVMTFPAPRAFLTRLMGLGFYANRARQRLIEARVYPRAIVANDHQECPLALALARRLGNVPVIGILRSSGINQRDFKKYDCGQCDQLMTVGSELARRVGAWTGKPLSLFQEGFCEEEFYPPLPWSDAFPRRLLVIGTEAPGKGFTDFIEALDLIESENPSFPSLECDFTGTVPVGVEKLLGKNRRARFRFIGRVNDFSSLVRGYSLAIHPSRAETFGMAPIEAILAGVPTLVSEAGIVESLPIPPEWRFPPRTPTALAQRMSALWQNWQGNRFDLSALQRSIRATHHIDQTTEALRRVLAQCGVT
jgi:glycosyltransferase involved in cell wall biosynthesis